MLDRALFTGHALNAIDAKGRVAIPAGLRQTIEANGDGRNLVVAKHEIDACLTGYDRGWARLLHDRLTRAEDRAIDAGREFDRHNPNRRAFALVEDVPFDSSGRFILPAMLRERAGLDDWALFLGAGDTFEIWNPKQLIDAPHIDEEIRDVARWLMKARAA